jgi:hypothetical protein
MTNETQKTAVEWYSRRLFEIEIAHNQGVINSDVYLKSKTHALEQAKEMEKEQRSIELPSHYEILDKADEEDDKGKHYAFIRGAKWMRDKIQGGEQ